MRHVLIGCPEDAVDAATIRAALDAARLEVDPAFRVIEDGRQLRTIEREAATSRLLLLLSRNSVRLFGSLLEFDERLAERRNQMPALLGVLLEGPASLPPEWRSVAEFRGAAGAPEIVGHLRELEARAAAIGTSADPGDRRGTRSSRFDRLRSYVWLGIAAIVVLIALTHPESVTLRDLVYIVLIVVLAAGRPFLDQLARSLGRRVATPPARARSTASPSDASSSVPAARGRSGAPRLAMTLIWFGIAALCAGLVLLLIWTIETSGPSSGTKPAPDVARRANLELIGWIVAEIAGVLAILFGVRRLVSR